MSDHVRIALDAMGGDHGPSVVLAGAAISHERHPDTRYLVFGDESLIRPELQRHGQLADAVRVMHTDVAVRMDDKPSQALRQGRRRSSMWLAIDAVRQGEADLAISAGNTGALMAMAKICLKTMEGIDRPAIGALWPSMRGESVVLDLGASIGAEAHQLVDMAIMGAAMARAVLDLDRPTVGLLNIGVEEVKGVEEVREAGRLLRELNLPDLEYAGFVEGDDIGKGTVDVVVTEGFAGNIALKAAEGTARQISEYLRAAFNRTWSARLGYVLARRAMQTVRDRMDPREFNGGLFLGLNGVVVKSHGGTDAYGFANAIDLGYDVVRQDLQDRIAAGIAQHMAGRERKAVREAAS
jgi:glycerol-3-phosphate acyltransferase PlsX